jgi:hypothetical protein
VSLATSSSLQPLVRKTTATSYQLPLAMPFPLVDGTSGSPVSGGLGKRIMGISKGTLHAWLVWLWFPACCIVHNRCDCLLQCTSTSIWLCFGIAACVLDGPCLLENCIQMLHICVIETLNSFSDLLWW